MDPESTMRPARPGRQPNALSLAVLPALVGVVFVIAGGQAILAAVSPGNTAGVAYGLRAAIAPIAIGGVLQLAALAVARRWRAGRYLGTVAAVLLALAGSGFIVLQLPYLEMGGMSAAFAGPFIVMAAVWTVVWAAYGWRTWRPRAGFFPEWQPADGRVAITLGAMAILSGGAWLGLGSVERQASVDFDAAYAQAQALIQATTLEVAVVDYTLEEAAGDVPPVVERLVLELTVRSPEAYPLLDRPGLCLVDRATYQEPSYKEDIICWGTLGSALILDRGFPESRLVAGATTVHLELDRGASPCAFRAGPWSAVLRIAPRTLAAETDGLSPWPQSFTIAAAFDVPGDAAGAVPSGGTARMDCLGADT